MAFRSPSTSAMALFGVSVFVVILISGDRADVRSRGAMGLKPCAQVLCSETFHDSGRHASSSIPCMWPASLLRCRSPLRRIK